MSVWTWISTRILDDPSWVLLPDDEWRRRFESLINNSAKRRDQTVRQEYMANWYSIRRRVFANKPKCCAYCGSTQRLEVDHIVPVARGGTNKLSNLQLLCCTCNRRKGARYE